MVRLELFYLVEIKKVIMFKNAIRPDEIGAARRTSRPLDLLP